MKWSKYNNKGRSLKDIFNIYSTIQGLRGYAISIYKNNWEDALDEAFFHLLENYDSSCGNLERYATRVVGTILLSKNRREESHDFSSDALLDDESFSTMHGDSLDILIKEEEKESLGFEECVDFLIPYFVKDFKFFTTKKSSDRTLDYSEMFRKFDAETILKAQNYITKTYSADVERLYSATKQHKIKKYKDDRIQKQMDTYIEYCGSINNTVLYKKKKGTHKKFIYKFDIQRNISALLDKFYTKPNGIAVISIRGKDIYCSPSGEILIGVEELFNILEKDLIGTLLTKTFFKVIRYEEGKDLLLSCNFELDFDVKVPIFNEMFVFSLELITSKEIGVMDENKK